MSNILTSALVFALGVVFALVIASGIVINWQWFLVIPLVLFLSFAYKELSERMDSFHHERDVSLSGYKGGRAYREGVLDEYEDEE
jgi:hypothetical protein